MRAAAAKPGDGLSLTERVLFERMGWFVEVRWAAGIVALVFLAMGWYLFDVRFEAPGAVGAVLGLFVYNAFFSMAARSLYVSGRASRRSVLGLAHAQIVCDLVAVAALVHYIGGVENHFVVLFIFPMVVASEFFPQPVAYAYATLAALLVNGIGWGEYFFHDMWHYPLRVLTRGEPPVYEPLVAPGAAHHWVFVLQVCFVVTFACYVTVFIASSIAARLRAREEELEGAYHELQGLELVKSHFMRKTSHELRAPVGALQSLLKAALRQVSEGDPGRDLVARATHRTEHMLDLIDDLLRYSRLRTAAVEQPREAVELAEIVRSAAELLRPRAEDKGVALEIRAPSAIVRGARDSLADLVTNLVSNAVRYTPGGGSVTVEVEDRPGGARLVVTDTGIGIPADELPHIFDEFFRGRQAKKTFAHGTGLGMSIVQRVAQMHGAQVEVASEVGRGTRFTVTFPAADRLEPVPKALARP